jgi:hypothetical protein
MNLIKVLKSRTTWISDWRNTSSESAQPLDCPKRLRNGENENEYGNTCEYERMRANEIDETKFKSTGGSQS